MIQRCCRLLLGLVLVLAWVLVTRPVQAGPARTALIAFTQNGQVFLMYGDGSDRRMISTGGS